MIVQFNGETRHEAIVNYFSLDIVEEEEFFIYMEEMGYDENDEDDVIENLISMWRENQP